MNKRIPTFALAVSMIFSSVIFSNFAQAVSKPTVACKKVGQTATTNGYQFSCIKSGKKIIWNNGVKIAPTSGTSTPSPLPKPSPSATKETASTTTGDPSQENLLGKTCTDLGSEKTTFYLWICVEVKDKGKIWIRKGTESEYSIISTNSSNTSNSQNSEPQSNLPTIGSTCPTFGQKISTATGFIRCDWQGFYSLSWHEYQIPKLSTSKSNSYKEIPQVDKSCSQSGDTYDVTSGYLECRYIQGGSLKWIKINSIKSKFTNQLSPAGTNVCKLQNSDVPPKSGRDAGQTAGFPTVARNGMLNPGTNEALIVGMDFPELKGVDADLKARNDYDKKMLQEWYSYFSNGKFKLNVTSIDHWMHAPNAAKTYSITGTFDGLSAQSNATIGNLAQKFVDIITKEVDLTKYSTVYLIYPKGEFTLDTDMIARNIEFKVKEGTKNLNFFGWGKDMEFSVSDPWAFYIHETLHDLPLIGHAPGNGWPFSIMANQSGISMSPLSWEQFQLGWIDDNQLFCIDKSALTSSTVSLSPMEREDNQTKAAFIRISNTKAVVVESHGTDKWSSFNLNDRQFPAGFYGAMVYLVDLAQAGAPAVGSDGRTIMDDTGNGAKYPRWAYWEPVDGGASAKWNWNFRTTPLNYNDYVAVLGDSITIEGVKIKIVGTGDYETVEISKA